MQILRFERNSSCGGEAKVLKCFTPDCNTTISEAKILRILVGKEYETLKRGYSAITLHDATKTIDNFHKCLFCDYGIIAEERLDRFHCENCNKDYCFDCKENMHHGPCGQEFHNEAERLTALHTIRCCGVLIVRADGCNKLTCTTCRKLWCAYCKQNAKNGYQHFIGQGSNGKCPLHGDPPEPEIIRTAAQIVNAKREAKERKLREKLERERQQTLERERLAREKAERERLAELERQRLEFERQEAIRLEQERKLRERLDLERLERIRMERERLEHSRLEEERQESSRLQTQKQREFIMELIRNERQMLIKREEARKVLYNQIMGQTEKRV